MSTIASGSSSTASDEPVGEHEPALGVGVVDLDGRAVVDVSTSPSFIAEPDGMLSVHIR